MKRIISTITSITMGLLSFQSFVSPSIAAYNEKTKVYSLGTEYGGFDMAEINSSEIKPKVYITVDGERGGKVFDRSIAGKTVECALCVEGANNKYASAAFHVFCDWRLGLNQEEGYIDVNPGKAVSKISPGEPVEDASETSRNGFFTACAGSSNRGADGVMWTFNLCVPKDAKEGDYFTIDIVYNPSENARDMFINTEWNEAGRLMQAYVFTKGIYNKKENNTFYPKAEDIQKNVNLVNIDRSVDAYIAIASPPQTTTTTTAVTTTTTTTATTTTANSLGDPNNDGKVDAKDASFILVAYSKASTGAEDGLTESQRTASNVNSDSMIDAKDASLILSYYAYISTHDAISIGDYFSGSWQTTTVNTTATTTTTVQTTPIGETIYENNNILVKYKGITQDSNKTLINLYIENNTDKDITVQTRNTSINGFMVDDIFSADISANKKINDSISVRASELEKNEISAIENIEFNLYYYDSDNWKEDVKTEPIKIILKE